MNYMQIRPCLLFVFTIAFLPLFSMEPDTILVELNHKGLDRYPFDTVRTSPDSLTFFVDNPFDPLESTRVSYVLTWGRDTLERRATGSYDEDVFTEAAPAADISVFGGLSIQTQVYELSAGNCRKTILLDYASQVSDNPNPDDPDEPNPIDPDPDNPDEVITSVSEKVAKVKVYPNPAQTSLVIDHLDLDHSTVSLEIRDLQGRMIVRKDFLGRKDHISLSIPESTPSGNYLLILRSKTTQLTEKIVLQ